MKEKMNAFFYEAYGAPSTNTFGTRPKPVISKPNHVIMKVHAVSLNPIDYRQSCGDMKLMTNEKCVVSLPNFLLPYFLPFLPPSSLWTIYIELLMEHIS